MGLDCLGGGLGDPEWLLLQEISSSDMALSRCQVLQVFYGGFIAVLEVCLGHDFINSLAFKLRKLKVVYRWLEKS